MKQRKMRKAKDNRYISTKKKESGVEKSMPCPWEHGGSIMCCVHFLYHESGAGERDPDSGKYFF